MAELQVYDVNFGTTKYEHSVLRKYFLKTAVSDRGSISLVFWCPYFESRFPTVVFQISEMPIELLGVGTDRRQRRFQLPTPNNSIGPSEVARDCFKAGCFRLPLVLLDGACVSLAWRGASALNIAPIGTPLRFFRVGPPQSLSESTQFGPITPK